MAGRHLIPMENVCTSTVMSVRLHQRWDCSLPAQNIAIMWGFGTQLYELLQSDLCPNTAVEAASASDDTIRHRSGKGQNQLGVLLERTLLTPPKVIPKNVGCWDFFSQKWEG